MRIAGLTLGLVLGFSVTTYAQQSFKASEPIECAWDQPAASLAEASALRVGAKIDALAEVQVTQACTGAASPFQCAFPLPASGRTVGSHTLTYRVGTVEFDSSVSYGQPISHAYIVTPDIKGAPAQPSNSRLRKIGAAIASAFKALFGWIG